MPETLIERRTRTWRRSNQLRALGFNSYKAFIESPRWAAKRSEYWDDPDTQKHCAICSVNEGVRILHHRTYDRVGEEDLDDLVPLCPPCHDLAHILEKRGDLALDADLEAAFDRSRSRPFVAAEACDPARLRTLLFLRPQLRKQYLKLADPNIAPRSRKTVQRNVRSQERRLDQILREIE